MKFQDSDPITLLGQLKTPATRRAISQTITALRKAGIETVGELRRMSVEELRRIWKLGEKGLLFILEAVEHPQLTHIIRPTVQQTISVRRYRNQLDYAVIEDGRAVGRIYEDLHAPPELRWFWWITTFVGYRPGVTTHGRTSTFDEAKARLLSNWQKCRRRLAAGSCFYLAAHVIAFA
jgi:Bacterial RNA polymerase, alpha chain C terminal domain